MDRSPDENPLYNKDGNAFTDALIEHWERQQIQSSKKWNAMDENTRGFNENQLKRVGMAEAFSPDLQEKMKQGVPLIQHSFQKEYPEDGNKVAVTLHLKKSATSDHYFLNKFDASLQKEGAMASIKQTFYLTSKKTPADGEDGNQQKNKVDSKYTLKEAYNLLAGRPVFKDLVNKEGQEYQAWVKLNPTKVLENGNHELKQYSQNYGFDLDKTLSNYPIKEMLNDQYATSLKDSLHRGNLQKATFVDKEGKEEKLYVSPNITLGALNVYDENKQRVPMEKLTEKQYIKPEFAEQIKDRLTKINQEQKPEKNQQKQAEKIKAPKQKAVPKQKMK